MNGQWVIEPAAQSSSAEPRLTPDEIFTLIARDGALEAAEASFSDDYDSSAVLSLDALAASYSLR
jgi:hypothetical protein